MMYRRYFMGFRLGGTAACAAELQRETVARLSLPGRIEE